jgi:hypothetical protein
MRNERKGRRWPTSCSLVLKCAKIVLDWCKEQATRAAVRIAVEELLVLLLPEKHTRQL